MAKSNKTQGEEINVLALFAGCGGFAEGFRRVGFNVLVANEMWNAAADTFEYNHPSTKMIRGDICDPKIKESIYKYFEEKGVRCNVVIGGPPCQAYSIAGKRDINDPRGMLFKEYAKVVEALTPDFFVMENVPGILTIEYDEGKVMDLIYGQFKKLGYAVRHEILNSVSYGVPQKRKRVIFIGTRHKIDITYPEPTHDEGLFSNGLAPYVTARQAIDELKNMKDNPRWMHIRVKHSPQFIEKIKRTPCGRSVTGYSESFFRVAPNEPTNTVKANNGSVFIHYEQDRTLTPREMATLQSFGYEYRFVGSKHDVLMQIGNSLPPAMAEAIAKSVMKMMKTVGRKADEKNNMQHRD